MDKIIVKNLLVMGIIGLTEEERIKKQQIIVNLEIFHDTTQAGRTDNLEYSIDYSKVVADVTRRIELGNDLLVEKLANDISELIISNYSAKKVMVRVEKPTIIPSTESVGVEIIREKLD